MTESDILAFNGNATSLCVTFAAKSILGDARNWANKNEAAKETVKNVELWHNLILKQQEKELRKICLVISIHFQVLQEKYLRTDLSSPNSLTTQLN